VSTLIKVRKNAFAANPSLKEQFTKTVEDVAYGGKSTFEGHQAELKRDYFLTTLRQANPGLTDFRVAFNESESS